MGVLLFGIAAILIELYAVEVPYYGYASLGFCIYFCCIINPLLGWQVACVIAPIALLARTLIINRQPWWYRISDFSSTLAMTMAAAYAFRIIYQVLDKSETMIQAQLKGEVTLVFFVAMIASAGAYFLVDFIIATTSAGLLNESFQKTWHTVRNKIRLFNVILFPLGVITFYTYRVSPWALLFLIPPLAGLRHTLKLFMDELVLLNQEELELSLKNTQNDLLEIKSKNEQITEDLQKKVDELSIVYEMGKALGASINLDGTLDIIISMIRKLIVYQSCVIFLLEKGNLTPAKFITPYKELLALSPLLQLEETIVNLVVQNRKPLLVPDMQTVNEQRIFKDEKCIMCVPLIIKERIIGVIYVGTTKQGTYNEDHLNILSILGNQTAIAIESAQLHEDKEQSLMMTRSVNEKLEKTVRQLSALNELGKSLGSSLKMDDTLNFIGEKMKHIIDFQSFIIFTVKKDVEVELIPQRCVSPYAELFKNITIKVSEGVLGWVVSQKKPLLLEDTRESRLPNVVEHERSAIIVPMIVENDVIGAFYVGNAQPHYYDEESLKLVSTVTYQTAMAIKNAELFERTIALAITDGVTGLYTHRYFQERILEACKEYERTLKCFSLIMLDTDHFKQYNDTLGHPEGDKLLREIAALIKSYTRDSDLVCRYGGDEFSVILKESDKANAIKTAQRIREAFQFRFHTYKVKVTASIGVSSFPEDATTKVDLVTAADAALYKSKKGGRNSVNFAPSLKQMPPQQPGPGASSSTLMGAKKNVPSALTPKPI
ncbi:MAG: diguanylate cyclase [Candidatus Eremiobacteraeota bacterium]|nr:diguanylate cyclase [Candidatus Eremiobacteraeota bacterium]